MPKHNKKGRSKSHGSFIMLLDHMTDTPAWRDLKPADIAVFLLIAKRYNGRNNGQIGLSVRCAAKHAHIATNTAQKSFVRLQERGLIKCRQKGAFDWKTRHASEWELTVWSASEGKPATHNYKTWVPPENKLSVSNQAQVGRKLGTVVHLNQAAGF